MGCSLCPRNCENELSFCGGNDQIGLALASLHFGEEPPITGKNGSGTVFLTGCNMRCPFCQNWQISRSVLGEKVSVGELVRVFLELQSKSAENINMVTGSHYAAHIPVVIEKARQLGLSIPVLWNSSAFEKISTLKKLSSSIQIWLPDLKTLDRKTAEQVYGCPDYPAAAKEAMEFMVQQGVPRYDNQGKMLSGTIIRHLIIPGHLESTLGVIQWFAENAKGKALLSLLSQYTPVTIPGETRPIPDRFVTKEEYIQVLQWLDDYDIEEGFIQELETGSDWLPDFNKPQPFSADLAEVIRRYI